MIALDVAVGAAFFLAALTFQRTPALAGLTAATGLLWFAGDLVGVLVFAHRATLTHVLLLYPDSRLRSRSLRIVVGATYVAGFAYPIGRLGVVTGLLFVAVLIAGLTRARRLPALGRRSSGISWAGSALVWGVLAIGAVARAVGAHVDAVLLGGYETVVLAVLVAITVDHRYRRSRTAIVTNLAVDLGDGGARSLREVLGEVLGDPTVVVGLLTPAGLSDEVGQPVALTPSSGQVVTDLPADEMPIARLQHDAALLRDRRLLESVTALAAVALTNVRLEHEVRSRIADVEASRRRLLAVADHERHRLEAALQDSVLTRLGRVEQLISQIGSADLTAQLDGTRHTIQAFARGVYPRRLEQVGLAALRDMIGPGTHLDVEVPAERFAPDVEAAAYFVCAEALTNVAKYAQATATHVAIDVNGRTLVVQIADNGVGGADPAQGTGLLGLQDRLDILGGTLVVTSSPRGTLVRGVIPW